MFIAPMKTDWDLSAQQLISSLDMTRISGNTWLLHNENYMYRISSGGFALVNNEVSYDGEFSRTYIPVPPGASVTLRSFRAVAITPTSSAWRFGYRICKDPAVIDISSDSFLPDVDFAEGGYDTTGTIMGTPLAWVSAYDTGVIYTNANALGETELIRVDMYSRQYVDEQNHTVWADGVFTVDPSA